MGSGVRIPPVIVRLEGEVGIPLQLMQVRHHLVVRGWATESRLEGGDVRTRGWQRGRAVEGRGDKLVQGAAREGGTVSKWPAGEIGFGLSMHGRAMM